MSWLIPQLRSRGVAVALVGAALAVAVQLAFGPELDWDPLLALAAGLALAALAGAAGGLVAGIVTAAVGAGLFVAYGTGDTDIAWLTVPAWLVAGAAAGLASDLWGRARSARGSARAELAALREAAPAALVTVGPDATVSAWNPAAERLFDLPAGEAIGAEAGVLGPEIADALAQARDGGAAVDATIERTDEAGDAFRLLVRALAFGAPDGEHAVLGALDTSGSVKLERALRDAEGRHEALARTLPAVHYVHPPGERGSLTFVGPQVKRLLGYEPEELVEGTVRLDDLVHADDRERVAEELRAGGQRPFRSEYRLVARDGRELPVRDEATTVRDKNGRPLYVQGFLVDLSHRLELEAERERLGREREEARGEALVRRQRLDLAVEAGDVLAAAADAETALRRVADLAVRDFADWCAVDLTSDDEGLTRLTAAHAEVIYDGESRAAAPEAVPTGDVAEAAGGSEPIVSPDGSRLLAPMVARGHTLGVLTFVRGARGRAYGADDLGLAADVARRAALTLDAARLHHRVELEADAARVLAYVADGVFLVDRTGVIRLWNPAAEAVTGYSADAMIGRRPSEAIPGWENFREQIPVAGEAGPATPETVWIETDEGQRWISISAVEFFGGTVYAFRDVTEAHRLEELKGDFVATASHELRTPLAAVYGAAQTLRRHDFALDEAGRERFVSMIVDEADRLSRIVNEILLATQLDGTGVDLSAELFDPRDLVNRVAEATRSHLRPEITLEVAASTPVPEVAADRDKVRQVLVNLVDNAVKYSPSGGRVELSVEAVDGNVRFAVRDEGLGIPADEQERIFEKFYRLDPAMTRGVGGTGLGLYICHELVRRMGGRIWVESTHGEGSTFSFELPAAVPAGPVPRDQSAPARA